MPGFTGRELEVVPTQSLAEGMNGLDVSRRVLIEHDHIVNVRCNLFQTLGNLIDDLISTRRYTAALRQSQALIRAQLGAKRRKWNLVLV